MLTVQMTRRSQKRMRLSVVGWYCSICWIILFQDSSSTYYVDGAGVVPLFSWAVPYSVERRCSEGFCNRCSRNIQQVMTHRRQGLYVVQRSDETFHLHHDNGDLSPMFTKSSNEMANMQNIGRDAGEGGCIIGDTKGATLLLENVSISRGSNQILQSVSLRVERNERWGIVGTNGCGKSSLLGAIMGTVRMDEGRALVAPKTRVGYLRQTAVSGSTKSVAEEAASEMKELRDAQHAMQCSQEDVANGDYSENALIRLDRANEAFELAGGWTEGEAVESVLSGLGFSPDDSNRPCSDFSGGWQMRIALARLLLSRPSLLLLDEPSNHLDSSARSWLASYLANYDGSMILVSHDVHLLEKSANSIAEIVGGTLLQFNSFSYSKYLEEKDFRARYAMAEYERNLAEATRLQGFVDRFGVSATKASAAQSRLKMLEKMQKDGKLAPPPTAVVTRRRSPKLVLPNPPKSIGDILIELKGASIGHDTQGNPLLTNINLIIQRGMKILLRGPNGAGKSTLMASLRGTLPLKQGERIENVKLRLGVFTQDLAQQLDPSARAIDLVTSYARQGRHGDITISNEDARGVMGLLGLGADKPLRTISNLSGGEKARVALSMFSVKASNLLLLDEPSNHLDVSCIDALGEALNNWGGKDGAITIISHDRAFCEKICFTHVGILKNGGIVIEERGLRDSDWTEYALKSEDTSKCRAEKGSVHAESNVEGRKADLANRRKIAFNAPKRITKVEHLIAKAEIRIAQLESEMISHGSDLSKLLTLTEKKEGEEATVAALMEEWEDLENIMAEFA